MHSHFVLIRDASWGLRLMENEGDKTKPKRRAGWRRQEAGKQGKRQVWRRSRIVRVHEGARGVGRAEVKATPQAHRRPCFIDRTSSGDSMATASFIHGELHPWLPHYPLLPLCVSVTFWASPLLPRLSKPRSRLRFATISCPPCLRPARLLHLRRSTRGCRSWKDGGWTWGKEEGRCLWTYSRGAAWC